jgi:hypothetical protein
MTGLFLRYCRRHRVAWPIASTDGCPSAEDGVECEPESADAYALIADLGREVAAAEKAED